MEVLGLVGEREVGCHGVGLLTPMEDKEGVVVEEEEAEYVTCSARCLHRNDL